MLYSDIVISKCSKGKNLDKDYADIKTLFCQLNDENQLTPEYKTRISYYVETYSIFGILYERQP